MKKSRRDFFRIAGGVAAATLVARSAGAVEPVAIKRKIPSSGEQIPVVGLGTSRTLNVSRESAAAMSDLLRQFFGQGGAVIDSSPMYGSAEEAIGVMLAKLGGPPRGLFSATKVWTDGQEAGMRQMEASRQLWGVERFDLIQIHNLRDWKIHIKTLKDWKERGRIRYIGITTSHGRHHAELESALKLEKFDFVQFTYNIADREVETRLLPLAADRGIATLINRPFQKAGLFDKVQGKPLPSWAKDFDCQSWAQFFLKWVIAHPQVTCAIPATSKVKHLLDNLGAGFGRLPDSGMRGRMRQYLDSI